MTVNLICIVAPPTKQCMHVDLLISYKHALTACVCVHRSDHIIHDHMCRKDKQCQNMLSKVITSYYWYGNLVWYSCPAWIELASFPGPSRGGGERAWYTLRAHAPGSP